VFHKLCRTAWSSGVHRNGPKTWNSLPSGGASAVKEPGHFEVRKSSSHVTRMHFFPKIKLTTFFSCRPKNTGRQSCFTVKIKQIKLSDMVTFLFSVHTFTEAKQYAGLLGRADEPRLEPGRWIFQPGHLTWRPGVAPPLSQPHALQEVTDSNIFKRKLKTFLFEHA